MADTSLKITKFITSKEVGSMPSKEEDTFKGGPLPGDVQVICDVLDSAVSYSLHWHVFYVFNDTYLLCMRRKLRIMIVES